MLLKETFVSLLQVAIDIDGAAASTYTKGKVVYTLMYEEQTNVYFTAVVHVREVMCHKLN